MSLIHGLRFLVWAGAAAGARWPKGVSDVPVDPSEVKPFRVEMATAPALHLGVLGVERIGHDFEKGFETGNAAHVFRRSRSGAVHTCRETRRFVYRYDFGDNWRHIVEIEEWLALDDTPRFAACLDAARARPPADVGGVSGFEAFLEILSDPLGAEHTEMKRWCGGHFDPEWFDLGWVDRDVRHALRANARRRLHQPKPRSAGHGSRTS